MSASLKPWQTVGPFPVDLPGQTGRTNAARPAGTVGVSREPGVVHLDERLGPGCRHRGRLKYENARTYFGGRVRGHRLHHRSCSCGRSRGAHRRQPEAQEGLSSRLNGNIGAHPSARCTVSIAASQRPTFSRIASGDAVQTNGLGSEQRSSRGRCRAAWSIRTTPASTCCSRRVACTRTALPRVRIARANYWGRRTRVRSATTNQSRCWRPGALDKTRLARRRRVVTGSGDTIGQTDSWTSWFRPMNDVSRYVEVHAGESE